MNSSPFDLSKTPTLQAVASSDEHLLVQDLQKRLDEALGAAAASPEVAGADEAHRAAEVEHANLQAAARSLNDYAKQLRADIAVATGHALQTLIAGAASGGNLDFSGAAKMAALELSDRLISAALQKLVEHLTPQAQIRSLRAEAYALSARARALEALAQQRAERVLGHLKEAVSDEVVLPVDLSKGVAGALLAQAGELKRRAIDTSTNADRLEAWYMENHRKEQQA